MSNKGKTQTARGRTPRFLVVLFAASMLTAAACGSSATEAESQVDGSIESETTTVATEPEEDARPSAADLIGTWERSNGVTWAIGDDMIFVTGGAVDSFNYSATDTTIELIDKACGEELPGTYEWAIADDVLSLVLVTDRCEGRNTGLGGSSLERTE